ncbi:uncharacterized protein BCR38DRAFT_432203 [Pseudomassariella vexata]|uniref:Secreted protein n=1 Tax=Pseudomassariella vexata TaxID=1141098 RepID=A0A1Y2E300_9PEZI|nr:uncharacterized protein BCR38DRAFT_432203 [Pseudomassariella vexata]ORY65245.1 hypothetical protein BCR38DRAFT_432203 [Pseudomassariella vexata]
MLSSWHRNMIRHHIVFAVDLCFLSSLEVVLGCKVELVGEIFWGETLDKLDFFMSFTWTRHECPHDKLHHSLQLAAKPGRI